MVAPWRRTESAERVLQVAGEPRPLPDGGELSDLRPGHVIELDQAVGAPVEIVLNREVVLARGEVVEVVDEYGVRITEIISDKAA